MYTYFYLFHQQVKEDWFHCHDDLFFQSSINSGVFLKQRLILSELLSSESLVLGLSHSRRVIFRVVRQNKRERRLCCIFRPPRFEDTDAAFPLIHQWSLMSPFLVGSLSIVVWIGVGKSAMTPSTLVVAPAMMFRALVGIDSEFVLWDNSSNMLKRY